MARLKINNQSFTISNNDTTPLLWYLRDHLQLTGTKFGCGKGLCGACTVLVDGRAVRSCITPVSSVVEKLVTTIEGISQNGEHSLQKTWKDKAVAQCGYCQSGQIMSALALLRAEPQPDIQQIKHHMSGNICRCGTYARIIDAIESVIHSNMPV